MMARRLADGLLEAPLGAGVCAGLGRDVPEVGLGRGGAVRVTEGGTVDVGMSAAAPDGAGVGARDAGTGDGDGDSPVAEELDATGSSRPPRCTTNPNDRRALATRIRTAINVARGSGARSLDGSDVIRRLPAADRIRGTGGPRVSRTPPIRPGAGEDRPFGRNTVVLRAPAPQGVVGQTPVGSLVPFRACGGLIGSARLRLRSSARFEKIVAEHPAEVRTAPWPCFDPSLRRTFVRPEWQRSGSADAPSAASSRSRPAPSASTRSSACSRTGTFRSHWAISIRPCPCATPARRPTSSALTKIEFRPHRPATSTQSGDSLTEVRGLSSAKPAARGLLPARRSVSRVLYRGIENSAATVIHLWPPVTRRLKRPTRGLSSAPLTPANRGVTLLFGLAPGRVCRVSPRCPD